MNRSKYQTIKRLISKAKKSLKKGDTLSALELYNVVIRINPEHRGAKQAIQKIENNIRVSKYQKQFVEKISDREITDLVAIYRSGQMHRAEIACNKMLEFHANDIRVIDILGASLLGQGKLNEALLIYKKLARLDPDNADTHYNAGVVLSMLERPQQAIIYYKKTIKLNPNYVGAYINCGNAYNEISDQEKAIAYYGGAINVDYNNAEAHYNMGAVLSGMGEIEKAITSYELSIQINNSYVEAHRNLSNIKEYKKGDPQIALMEELYLDRKSTEYDRKHLCFALFNAYEDLGEVDKSFNYLAEGNKYRKQELNYKIEVDRLLFSNIKSIFSKEITPASVLSRKQQIKPIFIVGMPRSGTSLVEQIVASHRDVYGGGEIKTIDDIMESALSDVGIRNNNISEEYINELVLNINSNWIEEVSLLDVSERVITDKMPLNFRWIGFILTAFPHAKIIHVNRKPIAVLWSIYKHYFSGKGNGYAYDMCDLSEYYKLYSNLMLFWRKQFNDRIYDVWYEELTEKQEEVSRNLLKFCDLEWDEKCMRFYETKRVVETASAMQVRKKMYKGSSTAWEKYKDYLYPIINNMNSV